MKENNKAEKKIKEKEKKKGKEKQLDKGKENVKQGQDGLSEKKIQKGLSEEKSKDALIKVCDADKETIKEVDKVKENAIEDSQHPDQR